MINDIDNFMPTVLQNERDITQTVPILYFVHRLSFLNHKTMNLNLV